MAAAHAAQQCWDGRSYRLAVAIKHQMAQG